jgi:LGFP repeat
MRDRLPQARMSKLWDSAATTLAWVTALLLIGTTSAFAFQVYGKIGEKYATLRGIGSPLGQPTSDEANAPYGGRFNSFQHGFIYWHPEIVTAYAVWGAIGVKWNQLGRVAYGYPITDESKTPDQRGRFNHFRAVHLPGRPEASIYWTPETGAVAIYGAIREKWAAEGWERGRMGYPTGDEVTDGLYRRSTFERGFIRWSSAVGPEVIPTSLALHEGGGFAGNVVNGIAAYGELPSGSNAELYREPTLFSHSELCARFLNQPGLNDTLRNTLISRVRQKLPSGFGIHSQTNHTTGTSCEARTELWSNSVSILIRVPGNRMFVRVTTPDGFPGSLDPNFVVTYDLIVRTSIRFPKMVTGSVVQEPVTVQGANVSRPESRSVTGNLVIAANDIISFLGGSDFIAAVRQGGVAQISSVNTGVAQLNQKLAQLRNVSPPGTRIEVYPQGDLVAVLATNRPLPPGPR